MANSGDNSGDSRLGDSHLPLTGVEVLDWAEGVAGPYACQLMADLGANVIKVERPQGDWGRSSGHGTDRGGSHFRALNRNKRNISIDLSKEGATAVARRLIERADVMVTAYRPGVTERLGIGYVQAVAANPNLIYVRVSAYGYEGGLRERPGSDTILQAVSGLMGQVGDADGDPQRVGVPVIDFLAARDVVIGVMSGLLSIQTGSALPGPVDVSLFASAATLQSQLWQTFFDSGVLPRRTGNRNPSLAPAGLYETRDGRHLAIAVLRDEHFVKLCSALDLEQLCEDPRFASNSLRLQHREELESMVVSVFRSKSLAEWVPLLIHHDILVGPVLGLDDIVADTDLSDALPDITFTNHDGGELGRAIGSPLRFAGHSPTSSPAPAHRGAHTTEILREVGFEAEEISRLESSEIVHVDHGTL